MSRIWEERTRLDQERRKKMQEVMHEYDTTVYFPAMKKLIEECEKNGHDNGKGRFHDNGIGWTWQYCTFCGGRYNVQGPEYEDEDGDVY